MTALAGASGTRRPGGWRGSPASLEVIAAAALGVAALAIAAYLGVKDLSGVPEMVRGTAATLALLALAGYAPARLLVPEALWPHFPLFVPLVGCATAGLGLATLGFAGVPFGVSLPTLLVVAAASAVATRRRLGPARASAEQTAAAGGWRLALGWPAYLAVLLAAVLVLPALSHGFATVQGTNPDAMLGVGAADLLQNTYPTSIDEDLPVDQMPLVWRSKYPIYYTLAGAASLSGLDPAQVFAPFSAVLAALTAAAFMLLARYALGAGPRTAVLVMALVGLDRAVAYLALHPYHNQLWGTLALALILLFGLRLLERPTRRDAVLLAGFLALGLAAYPLMGLYPALALGAGVVAAVRAGTIRLRRPRLPRSRRGRGGLAIGALVASPAALVLGFGVAEKSASAFELLVSGDSLKPWRGDLTHYLDPGFFVGVGGGAGYVAAALVLAAAVASTWSLPRLQRAALAAAIGGGVLFGVFFRLREFGEYFYFKVLAFLAPVALVAAALWLGARAARRGWAGRAAMAAAGVLVVCQLLSLRQEVSVTGVQLEDETIELGEAAGRLAPGASLRLDIIIGGRQLWAGYVLSEHPLTTLNPLVGTSYPHAPVGRKADYIVADRRLGHDPWPDASGPPLFENSAFRIYRMKAGVPGPDRSSKRMVDSLSDAFR